MSVDTASGRSFFLALLLSVAGVSLLTAHSMYQAAVLLDFVGQEVHVELQLPLERIEMVWNQPINPHTIASYQKPLTTYMLSRFRARTPSGSHLPVRLRAPLTLEQVDGAPYLVAHLVLESSSLSRTEVFSIEDDVLLDSIPTQVALVTIRSDWSTSVFANDPQLVGVLRGNVRSLVIDRTERHWWRGFTSVFRLGIRHIAEGTDHLLFLLALLLPAPLLVGSSRWVPFASVRQSLLRILSVVTAFTAGHSCTLALAALGLVHVPSRPVEVLIAVSILVSAVHALRPLFPGREAGIAAFFGLIHGLAFATTLGELGLERWERVASIFAFNLGIEAMQLLVVAVTMPTLLLLSRTSVYPGFRIGGALFAASASLGWILERLLGVHTNVDTVVDSLAHNAVWIGSVLFVVSFLCWRFRPLLREPMAPMRMNEKMARVSR